MASESVAVAVEVVDEVKMSLFEKSSRSSILNPSGVDKP